MGTRARFSLRKSVARAPSPIVWRKGADTRFGRGSRFAVPNSVIGCGALDQRVVSSRRSRCRYTTRLTATLFAFA